MARQILTGVSLALLVLVGIVLAEESYNELSGPASPFRGDLAYQFFEIGAQVGREYKNVTIVETHRNYDDTQCDTDIQRVINGLRSLDEWAIKCKHNFL